MTKKQHPKNPRLKEIEKEGKKPSPLHTAIPVNPDVNNQPVKEMRLGWFFVVAKMIDLFTFKQCQDFFKNFVIVRCHPKKNNPEIFEYLAFSPLFEPYESKLHPPPAYDVKIKLDIPIRSNGKMRAIVTARKIEQTRIITPGH